MQHDDDIAFQRAILANPADTTLKLVYADWLQDRADPRAEFVRRQVQLGGMVDPFEIARLPEALATLSANLDSAWVAFMTTLAQPFVPGLGSKGDPFADRVGMRGTLNVLESQLHRADELNDGLLADLEFLTSVEWGVSYYKYYTVSYLHGFVCDLHTNKSILSDDDIRTALGGVRGGRLTQKIREQDMFDMTRAYSGSHGQLMRYVSDGRLWYFATKLDQKPNITYIPHRAKYYDAYQVQLAVGRSPHGNRLVGALTYHDIEDPFTLS